jgi:arylsulfatase A-like enzyme
MSRVRRVLLILTDQQRADHAAREGYPLDPVPFMDELARRGAWFDRAYTASPLCVPARTSLITGRYPSAHRVRGWLPEDSAKALRDGDLYASARNAGFATAMIGKNHTFASAESVDHWYDVSHTGPVAGTPAEDEREFDLWLRSLRHSTYLGGATPFPLDMQLPVRIVDEAIRWIDTQQNFVAVVSFPEPHSPYQVPEPYFSMFPPASLPPLQAGPEAIPDRSFAWRYLERIGHEAIPEYTTAIERMRTNYVGMMRLIDDQIARLVAHQEATVGLDDTLIVFTSDHGEYAGEYGLVRKGAGLPEVLTRVPLVLAGGGVAPSRGALPYHVSTVDLFPTICEAIGAPIPFGVQGRSLWPMVTGAPVPAEEFESAYVELGLGGLPFVDGDDVGTVPPGLAPRSRENGSFGELNTVTMSGASRMVRRGDWKLVAHVLGAPELYHLPSDPGEVNDRWAEASLDSVRVELLRDLVTWMLRTVDPLPELGGGQRPKRYQQNYTVGG